MSESLTYPTLFQFGTSRFLQAHVDLFASQAMDAGATVPPIVVVQTTRHLERARRAAAFNRREGFPVRLRGVGTVGDLIDRTVTVRSVVAGVVAATEWPDLVVRFVCDAGYVVSNTGDRGYAVDAADRTPALLSGKAAPRSFPAMLLALLNARWRVGGAPVTMLPCELTRRNGDALRAVVRELAESIDADPVFLAWLDQRCLWINTLVDRIVSETIEPVGAVAEPYALWAVERQPELVMPFAHPAVVLTDDLERYERLKLHILNLGHSWLAQRWLDRGGSEGLTVREALADPVTRSALDELYASEVVPGFAARGLGEAAADYVRQTIMRFDNPFLDHQLADIAADHRAKVKKRVADFIVWANDGADREELPQLSAWAASAPDEPEIVL